MKIKHYMRVDEGIESRDYLIRKRSFKDEDFMNIKGDCENFTFFTKFLHTKVLDRKTKINFESEESLSREYTLTDEDIEEFGDLEKEYSNSVLGRFYDSEDAWLFSKELEEELNIRYKKIFLSNDEGNNYLKTYLKDNGLSFKQIMDFISSINAIHNEKPHMSFDEIIEVLLGDEKQEDYAENYVLLAKVLKGVEKYRNMTGGPSQLTIDLSQLDGENQAENTEKQKQ